MPSTVAERFPHTEEIIMGVKMFDQYCRELLAELDRKLKLIKRPRRRHK
jgi:hypothetical protein